MSNPDDHIISAMLKDLEDPKISRYSEKGILYCLKGEVFDNITDKIVLIEVAIDDCTKYGFNPYAKNGLGDRWPDGLDRGRYMVMQYSTKLQQLMRDHGFDPKVAHDYSCNLVEFVSA